MTAAGKTFHRHTSAGLKRAARVRGSLPTEVRSAVMEAIYQISSQPQQTT